MHKKRILFSGYAPVHFVCFLPAYHKLIRDPRVEVWLSGGFRNINGNKTTYSLEGFYEPFDVDLSRVITLKESREVAFDVVVCAHTSDVLFPKYARKKVQIFHGVSFKNLAISEKVLKFDYVCVPGAYHARGFYKRGLVRPGGPAYFKTGFMKLDVLRSNTLNRNSILKGLKVNPVLPTLLYAPTGAKKNSLEVMGNQLIENLSRESGWNLLIKPHDHPKNKIDWFSKLAKFENERVRLIKDTDITPYLFCTDLLLSDASSVSVEYTILDRPIIFLDVPKLINKAVEKGTAIDLETYGRKIGSVLEGPDMIVSKVKNSLANPDREIKIRRAMAEDVFYQVGGAADRVLAVVLHAAGLLDNLPDDVIRLEPYKEKVSI